MKSGEARTIAEYMENGWSVLDSLWSLHLPNKGRNDGHIFEFRGTKTVSIYYPVLKISCHAMSSLGS